MSVSNRPQGARHTSLTWKKGFTLLQACSTHKGWYCVLTHLFLLEIEVWSNRGSSRLSALWEVELWFDTHLWGNKVHRKASGAHKKINYIIVLCYKTMYSKRKYMMWDYFFTVSLRHALKPFFAHQVKNPGVKAWTAASASSPCLRPCLF